MEGKVKRGFIGIAGQSVRLTSRIVNYNNLNNHSGIYVVEVNNFKNLDNNALRTGDIIVEFEGKGVGSVDDLHKLLNENTIGIKSSLSVLRNGKKHIVHVVPAELI